jgi:hypothetical protein
VCYVYGGIYQRGISFSTVDVEVFVEVGFVAEAEVVAEGAMRAHIAAENAERGRGGDFPEFSRGDEAGGGRAGEYGV